MRPAWSQARVAIARIEASPADAALALLLVGALWLPAMGGNSVWLAGLAVVLMLATVRLVRRRSAPPAPLFFVAFVTVYVLAALHGWSGGGSDVARYFLRPALAVAVAVLVVTPRDRLRVLLLICAVVALEVPVTAAQAIANLIRYGREATVGADSVTGTLGVGQAGVVTLVAVLVAVLAVGAALARTIRPTTALAVAAACCSVGVFSATRAVIAFVPVAMVGMALALLAYGRDRPRLRALLVIAVASVAAAPVFYAGTIALYPDAFLGAISSQTADFLVGPAPGSGAGDADSNAASTPQPQGAALLPGRLVQLRLAVRLSHEEGPAVALLGRGPGAAEQDPSYVTSESIPLPQRTGTTWIGRTLTETGWLGLGAFVALLGWLALLGRKLWQSAAVGSADRAFAAALPGIAALTAVGATFTTILDVRGYSALFWVVVGLAISATYGRVVEQGGASPRLLS